MFIGKTTSSSILNNLFSGHDDQYNTIEGLKHGGMAEQKRKKMTEFGSGWDKFRALFKTKESFTAFRGTASFQKALQGGQEITQIGKGAFGSAHLMNAQIQVPRTGFFGKITDKLFGQKTHDLYYVRKTYNNPNMSPVEFIRREAKGMEKLSDLNAPTVYGAQSNAIYMEHFGGTDISEAYKTTGIPKSSISDFRSFIEESHRRGVSHADLGHDLTTSYRQTGKHPFQDEIVPRNAILTPEGKIGVYDFGLWQDPNTKHFENMLLSPGAKGMTIGDYAHANIGKRGEKIGDFDMSVVESLERHQGKLSEKGRAFIDNLNNPTTPRTETASTMGAGAKKKPLVDPSAETLIDKKRADQLRKKNMAELQLATTQVAFRNGISAGRKSRSSYPAAKVRIGPLQKRR